ncbi:MAG: hypothetical protein COB60_02615 [Flavobacteriaceae bacterium]|nr:MAG: hypothetical protein COB60_02615 [Flavobacteriaceae bacterium]
MVGFDYHKFIIILDTKKPLLYLEIAVNGKEMPTTLVASIATYKKGIQTMNKFDLPKCGYYRINCGFPQVDL